MTILGARVVLALRAQAALILLATFASLRWGEAIALRRCDLDLGAAIVRVRAAYTERSSGKLLLGLPKSRAGRRIVGIPPSIIPLLREHLARYAGPEPEALVFLAQGRPVAPQQLQQDVGMAARHSRHRPRGPALPRPPPHGQPLAAASGASLRDLMARMGHDSERAAIIYQHEARGADLVITTAIDAHIMATKADDPRPSARAARDANGPLMAHGDQLSAPGTDQAEQDAL
jgi:integrase